MFELRKLGEEYFDEMKNFFRDVFTREPWCDDAQQIYLQTKCGKPAYNFYKKAGFKEIDDHVGFFKELKNAL